MNNVDDSSNEVCASKIISEDIYSALRDSQKTSLDVSFDYLSQKNNNKSCLISLPTGGGKTGVICLLSHYSRQQKILVLCHRKAVKNQLIKQLSGGFFEKIDVKPTDELKVVNSDILDTTEDGIYVTTFQKLRLMTKEQMTVLRSDIDLVIVDEGHSEPSPEWSKLTRGLDAYKVVVTATPYRNDLFQFDISHEYSYFYSFKDAVAANDIEKPVFESIKKIELKSVIKNYLKINSGSKCIVKCDRRTDVEAYYELLNDDFRVLAVHDSFTNDERTNVKVDVPKNLDESDFDIIIHQRKLDEGVDIPQAKLLILTYAVGSGRELVQTVGRVVRKFNGLPAEVKEIESDKNNRVWDNYLKFDKYLSNKSAADKFFKALDLSSLLKSYTDSFPDMSYLGNRYAAKLDLNSEKLIDAIEIPLLSVVFKNKKSNFDFQDMMETLIWRSVREGEYVKEVDIKSSLQQSTDSEI
ncbi:DEAD/DEAH box helicase family protein, partial [uncultured Paraglaciecola sp.]|uniref:DEAD/DEAH box helicase n=1 Tax=uncultured Paraglaciecola sp. TaxID=1765024 RepID=UPI002602F115